MKTEDLINRLSSQLNGGWSMRSRRAWTPLVLGLSVNLLFLVSWFPLNGWVALRNPTPELVWRGMFLIVWTFWAGQLVWRLQEPAQAWRVRWQGGAVLMALCLLLVLISLAWVEPEQRWGMVLGQSWFLCSISIGFLALPLFMAGLYTARHWAVTRPTLTGAALGLCSGTISALLYTLHCTETDPVFVLVWYGLGVGLPTVLGAYAGRRFLGC